MSAMMLYCKLGTACSRVYLGGTITLLQSRASGESGAQQLKAEQLEHQLHPWHVQVGLDDCLGGRQAACCVFCLTCG